MEKNQGSPFRRHFRRGIGCAGKRSSKKGSAHQNMQHNEAKGGNDAHAVNNLGEVMQQGGIKEALHVYAKGEKKRGKREKKRKKEGRILAKLSTATIPSVCALASASAEANPMITPQSLFGMGTPAIVLLSFLAGVAATLLLHTFALDRRQKKGGKIPENE